MDNQKIVQAGGEGLLPPQHTPQAGTWLSHAVKRPTCERCEQYPVGNLGICHRCQDEQEWVLDEMRDSQQRRDGA